MTLNKIMYGCRKIKGLLLNGKMIIYIYMKKSLLTFIFVYFQYIVLILVEHMDKMDHPNLNVIQLINQSLLR